MLQNHLTAIQADAILDLRLQRLTNLEQLEIERECKDTEKQIKRLKDILGSKSKLDKLIVDELTEIRGIIDSERRTVLIDADTETVEEPENIAAAEPMCLLMYADNKLRRLPPKLVTPEFLTQEKPIKVFSTATDRMLRLFTTHGALISISMGDIPESRINQKPTNLSALTELEKDEKILSAFDDDFTSGKLYFYTRNGLVKCTEANEYATKTKRIAAVTLKDDDALIGVEHYDNDSDAIMLVTSQGMSIRFDSASVPVTGRTSSGVKGIKLNDNDFVIFAAHVPDEGELLTVTDRGCMKRSFIFDHDIQGRNGKGVLCFSFKKNGGKRNSSEK